MCGSTEKGKKKKKSVPPIVHRINSLKQQQKKALLVKGSCVAAVFGNRPFRGVVSHYSRMQTVHEYVI